MSEEKPKTKRNIAADKLATVAAIESLLQSQKKIKTLYSYEVIQGEGYGFYYSPDEKMFVKVNAKTKERRNKFPLEFKNL